MNDLAFGATLLSLLAMLTCAACLEATQAPVRQAAAPTTITAGHSAPVRIANTGTGTAACVCAERAHLPIAVR